MSKSLTTHFLREWRKRLDHSRTLFFRATIAICSQSHFCKEGQEQIAHGCSLKWAILRERAKSKWAKERIPNSRFLAKLVISMEEYYSYEKVTICVFFVRKRNDLRLFCMKKSPLFCFLNKKLKFEICSLTGSTLLAVRKTVGFPGTTYSILVFWSAMLKWSISELGFF